MTLRAKLVGLNESGNGFETWRQFLELNRLTLLFIELSRIKQDLYGKNLLIVLTFSTPSGNATMISSASSVLEAFEEALSQAHFLLSFFFFSKKRFRVLSAFVPWKSTCLESWDFCLHFFVFSATKRFRVAF